ncbi:NirD/YgiW/YdeI family stress tolerance protein [Variovorax robiniae]|uniref:NirD/YgiW/YdeI family stress tolerance protein n=1 Tax=Variovorax robiniae TaxID=1836199 RepID=A0ABU8XJB2_9BURK
MGNTVGHIAFARILFVVLAAAGSLCFGPRASAAGDHAAVDMGPRAVTAMTTRQVLDHGRNEQVVRLRGRIASHEGGQNYTCRDHTGSLPVTIERAKLPAKQTLRSGQRVELDGQIFKEMRHKLEFRVKQVRLQ